MEGVIAEGELEHRNFEDLRQSQNLPMVDEVVVGGGGGVGLDEGMAGLELLWAVV